jgi:hypothetical protein
MKFFAISLCSVFLTFSFASGQDFISDAAAIRLSYSNTPDRKIEGTTTEVGLSQWAIMSPIFFHKGESWSFGAGFRYESTNLDFSDASVFDEDHLHSIDLPLFFSKTQSDTLDWMFLFNPTLAGDYEQVDGDSLNYLAIGGARWKRSETFEWFFGAVYTTGFGDDLFLPAIRTFGSLFCGALHQVPLLPERFFRLDFGRQHVGQPLEYGSKLWGERLAPAILPSFPHRAMEPGRKTCNFRIGGSRIGPRGGNQERKRINPARKRR